MTDSPMHAAPWQAASPPTPARSRLGLDGGCGRGVTTNPQHPLLVLALTDAVRLVDRRSVDILFFPLKGTRAKPPPHPKIDRGRRGMTDSPMHAAPRQAASLPAPARSRLGLAGGCGGGFTTTPPHPLLGLALTHSVCLVDRRSTDILFFHQRGRAQTPGATPPNIDMGRRGMTDSPMHAAPGQAASPPAPARSRLGLVGGCGGGSRPLIPTPCSALR